MGGLSFFSLSTGLTLGGKEGKRGEDPLGIARKEPAPGPSLSPQPRGQLAAARRCQFRCTWKPGETRTNIDINRRANICEAPWPSCLPSPGERWSAAVTSNASRSPRPWKWCPCWRSGLICAPSCRGDRLGDRLVSDSGLCLNACHCNSYPAPAGCPLSAGVLRRLVERMTFTETGCTPRPPHYLPAQRASFCAWKWLGSRTRRAVEQPAFADIKPGLRLRPPAARQALRAPQSAHRASHCGLQS